MANVKTKRIPGDVLEKPRREPLSRERIIQTAVRIMDKEGLDALSMRRIGRELEVEAMSLYNHVQDKEDIRAHEEMARMLASADLPRMREAMPHFLDCNLEEQFEFGLDLLIEGIRARIASTP